MSTVDRNEFREYLKKVGQHTLFQPCEPSYCPIACYLAEKFDVDPQFVEVYGDSFAVELDDDDVMEDAPPWVGEFVNIFDGEYPSPVGAEEALAVLDTIEESERVASSVTA